MCGRVVESWGCSHGGARGGGIVLHLHMFHLWWSMEVVNHVAIFGGDHSMRLCVSSPASPVLVSEESHVLVSEGYMICWMDGLDS